MSDDDLAGSLAGLAGLLTGHRPLSATLTEIAEFAVQAVPGAEGAGLSMLDEGRSQTLVATGEVALLVDDTQYVLGEGPGLSAVGSGRTQHSGSLGGDPRWPRFGPRAGRLGVHSVLSLPLLVPGRVLGAITLYARGKSAFGEESLRIGELFARPAAVSVDNAHLLARSQRLAEQLQSALTSRAVIDQALGIIRSRTGAGPDEAFERLRAMSQDQHTRVADVAAALVEEAVRRARAGSHETGPRTASRPGSARPSEGGP